jgi:molybdenum cofactor synthesis domain-containing protein
MCDISSEPVEGRKGTRLVDVDGAVGMVLAHDITEIRQGEFKGRAFRKGHVVRTGDIEHLKRLGKEHLYILELEEDELHEDEAAVAMAKALASEGVGFRGEPKEGKMELVADRDGLLKVDVDALHRFNMLGEVMCASLHTNTLVEKGRVLSGVRAIPLVVSRSLVDEAIQAAGAGVFRIAGLRRPKVGVVITGNEVYYGRIKDAFAPIIESKIKAVKGEIVGTYFAPDDQDHIEARLQELLDAGADLLITTGGMSVDPDDVTRFAIRKLGAEELHYGAAVLPGAMFLTAYIGGIPMLGIPACGMYHRTTALDLVLPRILAGEHIGRSELAAMGHGGMCLNCKECCYPLCPFGKGA